MNWSSSLRFRFMLLAVLACAGLAAMIATRSVEAATFTVLHLDDSGPGSLRQAILDANGNLEADSIDFAAGLTGTITLMSSLPEITEDVMINGPGAQMLTVSGNSTLRVFDIAPGVTTSISGLTISNGTAILGGGIYNAGTLTVTNSSIFGNTATESGGGIYNIDLYMDNIPIVTLDLKSSIVANNTASYGPEIAG
jgi:hypothetical protein